MTFKYLIFENFRGPEVVGSSSYQKNIGTEFTHLYRSSLCYTVNKSSLTATTLATLVESSKMIYVLRFFAGMLTLFQCIGMRGHQITSYCSDILGKISKRSKFNRKMIRFTVTKNLNCFIANFFNFFHHCSGAIQKL